MYQVGNQILRHHRCSWECALFYTSHFTSFAYNNISVWQVLLPVQSYYDVLHSDFHYISRRIVAQYNFTFNIFFCYHGWKLFS